MSHDQRFKLFFRRFFREFLVLFYPRLAAQIDWSEPFEFLDKEMQKLAGDKTGRTVDVLIKYNKRRLKSCCQPPLTNVYRENQKGTGALKPGCLLVGFALRGGGFFRGFTPANWMWT